MGTGGIQVLDRALGVLDLLATAPEGLGISELSARTGLPLPTAHRILKSLVHNGYVRRTPSRQYALGPALVPLGQAAASLMHHWARPHLVRLVDELGETANLAMLEGDSVVYLAQVPSRHSMRMFTEVGRRVSPHCTGVGKALLATLPADRAREILGRTGLEAHTERTFTDLDALMEDLALTRARGYAIDDGERERGVRCVAVALPDSPTPTAISVSGPASRVTLDDIPRIHPVLAATAAAISADLAAHAH
jgi:IclR family acetate operon transcriptional repressor